MALLNTTHGSSGPETKPFQNTPNAAGVDCFWLARLTGGVVRVASSQTITAMAAARKIEREMTSVPHLRSGLFSRTSLPARPLTFPREDLAAGRSEEHTSEL